MEKIKKIAFVTAVIGSMLFTANETFAQEIGYVDDDKIIASFGKTQEIVSDLKIKEAELQKFLVEARKTIKSAKDEQEKKSLEDKYNQELEVKKTALKDEYETKWDSSRKLILDTINSVAKKKGISIILRRESILSGGTDLTSEVISTLNNK